MNVFIYGLVTGIGVSVVCYVFRNGLRALAKRKATKIESKLSGK